MDGLIQAFPTGLMSLLGIKGNSYPKQFQSSLMSVVEIGELYRLQIRETVGDQVNVPAVGANNFSAGLVVPTNEVWWVDHFFVSATGGAASTLTGLQPTCKFGSLSVPLGPPVDVAVTEQRKALCSNRPFIAGPAAVFGFNVANKAGADIQVQGGAVFARLRI